MVQQLNQKKMKAPLWNKYSFKGFVKKHPKNEYLLHRPDFHYFLLIICDNWIVIVFFNIKPSNTKKYKMLLLIH